MHWVVQNNIHRENGYDAFIEALERRNIPHTLVKVIPFAHELEPDVNPDNPVIAIGSYTLGEIAEKKGWNPGVYANENFHFNKWKENYGEHLLNYDGRVLPFAGPVEFAVNFNQEIFVRPCEDGKEFTGMLTTWQGFMDWRNKVVELGESTIKPDAPIFVAAVKEIYSEYRFFIVDGKVITGSQYKLGNRVVTSPNVDRDISWFAWQMVNTWCPAVSFVLDIAMTPDGLKVIEINSMNSSGFYACDMSKVIEALEDLY